MSAGFSITVPPELVEAIARRVVELLEAVGDRRTDQASAWLDVEDACAYLRLSRDSLYKLTAARAIPFRKKAGGQGLRFHRAELDAWIGQEYPRVDRLA